MLEVQKFLKKHDNFDELEKQFGIKAKFHESDNRVILNYCQINSYEHKDHPIVKECRGLVLDKSDYSLIARSFPRFFNFGEVDHNDFDWHNFVCQEKLDGSLILFYYWNDDWHVNTRNSFGSANIGESDVSWRELVFDCLPPVYIDKNYVYVFELCSPYNQVVKHYPVPFVRLLAAFEGERELNVDELKKLPFKVVDHYDVDDNDFLKLVNELSNQDPTNEGVVLRDKDNNRIKVKAKPYLRLHRLFSNGNVGLVKNLVPLIMNNEIDEILPYWPHLKGEVQRIKGLLGEYRQSLENEWLAHGDEDNRKKFALAVKDHPFSSLLFKAKDCGKHPIELFDESQDLIIKVLKE